MKNTLKSLVLVAAISLNGPAYAQEFQRELQSFTKITASPRINLVLQKGDKESVRVIYSNIDPQKINVEVNGNKLKIYLDDSRIVEKQYRMHDGPDSHKESMYKDANVTAFVTYNQLEGVEIRGEQELTCESDISGDVFELKAYGESEITFKSLHVKKFKASLYGVNKLKVKGGQADHQVYRLFGENKIDTRALTSETAATRIYGEGRLSVNASDEVRITAFGEPQINVTGTSHISKGIILGNADIRTNR